MLRVVILWLIGYTFFVFHGISSHLTPCSQAFINAMVKFTYGTTGQRETTVVLFREENLHHLGVQYPVDAPDWKKLCQEANQTPAGRAAR